MADTGVNTPAPLIAEEGDHTYKFNISMSCGGCSGAVDRVLKKLDGEFVSFPRSLTPYTSSPLLLRARNT